MTKIAKKAPAKTRELYHMPDGALNIDLNALEQSGFDVSIDGNIVSIMGREQLSPSGFEAWQHFINEIGLPIDEAEDALCDVLDAAMWHHVRATILRHNKNL